MSNQRSAVRRPGVDSTSIHAEQAIRQGSKSFAAAARLFDPATRDSAVKLYAWCRHCDDVIDGQSLGHGQVEGDRGDGAARIAELRALTRAACRGDPMTHPAFVGLQEIVRTHGIPEHYLMEHLAGFAMDVDPDVRYESIDDTLRYAWRVAGVVGVMMALLMGTRGGDAVPASVLDRACDLGVAFQFTNIARDIVEDACIGRVYLPAQWLREAGLPVGDPAALARREHRAALATVAARLVEAAEPYYRSSMTGIATLPIRSAWSIATARGVYRHIGHLVRERGARAWDQRAATSRWDKLRFVARGGMVALLSRALPPRSRAPQLWRRPV
ncbi:phytoene/squalene synthase family protein [Variovorax sp. PvP013_2]